MDVSSGWERDEPDLRDYKAEEAVEELLKGVEGKYIDNPRDVFAASADLSGVDLSQYCLPIRNQGSISDCVAQAAVNMIGCVHKRKYVDFQVVPDDDVEPRSVRFLYWTTRKLMGRTGNRGTKPRTCMKALQVFGIPKTELWSEDVDIDDQPDWFVARLAELYTGVKYVRHDPFGVWGMRRVESVKSHLRMGLPSILGYYSFQRSKEQAENGWIRYPGAPGAMYYAHGVCVVGYDDSKMIPRLGEGSDKGAFKFQNSWGTDWGRDGYGWLPYKFVESGMAFDIWSLIDVDWVDLKLFND